MKVYYAHPVSIYNTPQEGRDVELLASLGFEVLNPNNPVNEEQYNNLGMELFLQMVESCQCFAFRGFVDGTIPSGVMKEMERAKSKNIPVFELPTITSKRILSVDDTREYLKLLGTR